MLNWCPTHIKNAQQSITHNKLDLELNRLHQFESQKSCKPSRNIETSKPTENPNLNVLTIVNIYEMKKITTLKLVKASIYITSRA